MTLLPSPSVPLLRRLVDLPGDAVTRLVSEAYEIWERHVLDENVV